MVYFAVSSYIQFSKAEKQLRQKKNYISNLEQDMRNLKEIIRKYQEERDRFSKLLFTDRDVATFLEEFGRFAEEAKVKIIDMKVQSFQKVKPEEEFLPTKRPTKKTEEDKESLYLCSMPIVVNIVGSFEQITHFLFILETYRQLLTISNINIKTKKYPELTCTFTLRLYSLKKLAELKK
jgi:Tfp pilus assembly protein PilO